MACNLAPNAPVITDLIRDPCTRTATGDPLAVAAFAWMLTRRAAHASQVQHDGMAGGAA